MKEFQSGCEHRIYKQKATEQYEGTVVNCPDCKCWKISKDIITTKIQNIQGRLLRDQASTSICTCDVFLFGD